MKVAIIILFILVIVFALLWMHSSEKYKTEGFTETKRDMSVFSAMCEQNSGIAPEKLGAALQLYSQRTGLPSCSTLETQAISAMELRYDGHGAGTSFGWKIFWQPLSSNISSYHINFQYDGGCPKGVQEFILSGQATEFELPQPLRPRFRIMIQAKDASGANVGSPALAEFVVPHDPNKWA
ncbi:hypothetical protein B1750_gp349 [Noumeavirus]|uniref:Uncharacterized protein n=1 Tax=Marseillevirus sp. TaxID=2809551 RepID=A0AA96J3L7_9VIRU|nr:hypothetical protein B1750_gp349 [Noumeavirus]AQM73330.1 hypothetical protein NMV_349 [Noumeavirus]AQQ73959.1 putative membrane protein [Kurlavirus BKC-1]QZX43670.1 membrane protein [Marseillevirus sp.]WNL50205.1 hypothetical protein MarDSR_166 [Marseillevirus sp.]